MNTQSPAKTSQLAARDIRLLQSFVTVVEEGGFVGAQIRLNVSASTISTRIADLETRLGMRLCTRGRSGFQLTESGERVFNASHRLFAAHGEFSGEIWSARQHQTRVLKIGVADNVIDNDNLRLDAALGRLCEMEGPIEIHMSTLTRTEIEQRVLSSEIDIGIGAFSHKIPGLHYEEFMLVDQVLCCGKGHQVFDRVPHGVTVEEVTTLPYVARTYMGEYSAIPGVPFKFMAYAQSMEAIALLVLSGHYIGHLPKYYARGWVDVDRMRIIQPERLVYQNHFGFTYRESVNLGRLVRVLSQLLRDLHPPSNQSLPR